MIWAGPAFDFLDGDFVCDLRLVLSVGHHCPFWAVPFPFLCACNFGIQGKSVGGGYATEVTACSLARPSRFWPPWPLQERGVSESAVESGL